MEREKGVRERERELAEAGERKGKERELAEAGERKGKERERKREKGAGAPECASTASLWIRLLTTELHSVEVEGSRRRE